MEGRDCVDPDCVRLHSTPQLDKKLRSFHRHGLSTSNTIQLQQSDSWNEGQKSSNSYFKPPAETSVLQVPKCLNHENTEHTSKSTISPGLVIMPNAPWLQHVAHWLHFPV